MEKTNAIKQEMGIYGKLCQHRSESAKLFPHRGNDAEAYIKRVQGAPLSNASVKALGRA